MDQFFSPRLPKGFSVRTVQGEEYEELWRLYRRWLDEEKKTDPSFAQKLEKRYEEYHWRWLERFYDQNEEFIHEKCHPLNIGTPIKFVPEPNDEANTSETPIAVNMFAIFQIFAIRRVDLLFLYESDRAIAVKLHWSMQSMMCTMFELEDSAETLSVTPSLDENCAEFKDMIQLITYITQEIEDCGRLLSLFSSSSPPKRTDNPAFVTEESRQQLSNYISTFVKYTETFVERRFELQSAISTYMTITQARVNAHKKAHPGRLFMMPSTTFDSRALTTMKSQPESGFLHKHRIPRMLQSSASWILKGTPKTTSSGSIQSSRISVAPSSGSTYYGYFYIRRAYSVEWELS